MTDTSFSVKPINGPALSHASLAAAYQSARHQHYRAPAQVDVTDDDGQISCICGYADDDGWTVACDLCNKWQHQICYYPGYDERTLPDELQHYCIECKPRDDINIERARQRQREKRKHPEPLTNGVKRNASKSHKKKVKEPATSLPNGLHDKFRHDRNSASPRDQPPPAKRPKTTHRTSDSTTTTAKGHSRKRNASTVNHRRSLSRSPDSPVEQYSEEFLHCYMDDDWAVTNSNLHNSIAVTNALSEWLKAPEEDFRNLHNQAKGEVLMRWDGELEDIPGKAQTEIRQSHDENIRYQGQHPTWKTITVRETVASGAYIGELKGHVGFKKEYQHDPSNRWAQLRHPEPFVFFHPQLPIVIDARHEGTELRYVRRSCMPNARLQILVTDGVDYHFCFMATQQIEPGDEVAVGWDTGDGLPELASRTGYSDDELEVLSGWVSTALANYGPCACQLPEQECMMSRFDRRIRGTVDTQPAKAPKGKKRKMGQQISPINTHAINSRSGSEARKVDHDDDRSESRSTSGSVGRGSASRDMTPNTHYSSNGQHGTLPELSERERKKLAKEEEIFRRQEEEQAGKQAKKKRNSGGSALNTPSASSSSKQLGYPASNSSKYVDASTQRQSDLPVKSPFGRRAKAQKPPSRPASRTFKRSKPIYVDSEIQCDMEKEEAAQHAPTLSPRRPFLSTRQRLLELCARNNAAVLPSQSSLRPITTQDIPGNSDKMDVEQSVVFKPESSPVPTPVPLSMPTITEPLGASTRDQPDKEVEMQDPSAHGQLTWRLGLGLSSTAQVDDKKQSQSSEAAAHPSSTGNGASADTDPPLHNQKSPVMHLQMPPPITNFCGPGAFPQSAGSPSTTPGVMVQSPGISGPGPLFSPSVAAERGSMTQKKKMSLSDYKARRMAKDKDNESKTDRESSPASVASGPIVLPLQPSSSSEAKAAEGGSAIDDDVSMEDAHEAIKAP